MTKPATPDRVYSFADTQIGKQDFRLCYEAFRGRDPQKCTKEERPTLAALQRAFEAISVPVGDLPPEAELDLRQRTLQPGGGEISLAPRVFARLKDVYIPETPFMAGLSMQVEDLLDRLAVVPTVKVDPAKEPEPALVGEDEGGS